jgi:hypothetical protein
MAQIVAERFGRQVVAKVHLHRSARVVSADRRIPIAFHLHLLEMAQIVAERFGRQVVAKVHLHRSARVESTDRRIEIAFHLPRSERELLP